jgi:hypothetical protein
VSAEEVGAERGVLGVYPDGGRSIWLLGMLITFKAVGEETGGEYSVFEQTVPPRAGCRHTYTTRSQRPFTSWRESSISSQVARL